MGVDDQCHTLATLAPEKKQQEADWTLGSVWMGLENLTPTIV